MFEREVPVSRIQVLRWMLIPSLSGLDRFRPVPADKKEVQEFWTRNPNLINEAHSQSGTQRFFEEVDGSRKQTHWPLYEIVHYAETHGLDVLEVGCGLGTDAVEFAKSGARYTGIDLTEPAVELTREKLAAYGLPGTTQQADAEQLPFPDESFDVVVAMYVLTVVADTAQVKRELERDCRPGGQVLVVNHFSQDHGVRGVVEKAMGRFGEALGWRPDFPVETVMVCDRLKLVEAQPSRPFNLFTILRFIKDGPDGGSAIERQERHPEERQQAARTGSRSRARA
jgi:SAM-dependent methyltransferase